MRSERLPVLMFLFLFFALMGFGCATVPTGPSVMVLPAQGKPFDQFRSEDALCRQWARQQIGLSPQETVNQNTTTGAVIGTIVGAGVGAALGAASGHAGQGAAIGAGTGLLFGAAEGSDTGRYYGYEAQRRYDHAYVQCMYAKGNQIPGVTPRRRTYSPPPPPPNFTPGSPVPPGAGPYPPSPPDAR